MKYIILALTIIIELVFIFTSKIFDSFHDILWSVIVVLFASSILHFVFKKDTPLQKIGWGIFAGTLVVVVFIGSFLLYLSYNWPQ